MTLANWAGAVILLLIGVGWYAMLATQAGLIVAAIVCGLSLVVTALVIFAVTLLAS
jgi:hypothetical protein